MGNGVCHAKDSPSKKKRASLRCQRQKNDQSRMCCIAIVIGTKKKEGRLHWNIVLPCHKPSTAECMPFTHTQQFTCLLFCTAIYLSSPEFYSWLFSSSSGFNRPVNPPRQVVVHQPCQLHQHPPATLVHWTKPQTTVLKSSLRNPSHYDASIQSLAHSYAETMCLLPVTIEIHNYCHYRFNTAGHHQFTLSSSLANTGVEDDVSINHGRSPQHASLQRRISTLVTSIRWLLPTIYHSWEKCSFSHKKVQKWNFIGLIRN